MVVEVVENPRKRRRRRTTRKRRTYRRRRNPLLASLANPKRRRRTYRKARRRRTYRRRRNPMGIGLKNFPFTEAMYIGGGMLGAEIVPMMVRKWWPELPASGTMGYLVKAGGALATAFGVKMLTRSNKNFQYTLAGGLALILVDAFRQFVAPKIGLLGLGNYSTPIRASQLKDVINLNGYVRTGNGLSGYTNLPVGAY